MADWTLGAGAAAPRVMGSEIINVRDYNAKGDDATDDTVAIAAAVAAAGTGKMVYFPAGTYRHTGFTINKSITLAGDGWWATKLRNVSASTPAVSIERAVGGPAPNGYISGGPSIIDLQMIGTSTGAAVLLNTMAHVVMRNVHILQTGGHGIHLSTDSHVYGLVVDHCVIEEVAGDGIYGRGEGARQVNAIRVLNGTEIARCGGAGFNVWGTDLVIRDSIIEGNTGPGIKINADDMATLSASARSITIDGNYLEANDGGAIWVSTTGNASTGTYHYVIGLRIVNNYVNQLSAHTTAGVTAAITLKATDGAGGACLESSSYRGVILEDNFVTVDDASLAYVAFNGDHTYSTRLTPFYGSERPGGVGAFNVSYTGAEGVYVVGDTYRSAFGAPTTSADFVGQSYLDPGTNTWYRAKSAGSGAADWYSSFPLVARVRSGSNLLSDPTALDAATWQKANVTVTADVDGTADRVQVASSKNGLIYQAEATTAGSAYLFYFDAKANGTGNVAKFLVWDVTNNRAIVTPTDYFPQLNAVTYTRISTRFTVPAGCTSVAVYPVGTATSGTETVDVYIKDLALYAITPSYQKFGHGTATILNGQQTVVIDLSDSEFTAAPNCVVTGETANRAYKVSATATALTVDAGAVLGGDEVVHYICMGK